MFPRVDPARSAGRALWEWSAVGGPTIQAAYRVDGLGAIAVAVCIAYAGAALATAARADDRHPALPAVILALGLVSVALVVTDDLIAATVPLGVLASLSVLALLAVAPPAATARAAAFMAIGLQAWVLAALLISRRGSASFQLGAIPPSAVVPEAILAATIGGLLFAGLYPFVAWSFEGKGASGPGPLGGLLLMPIGIGSSVLLLRLLGAARTEVTRLGLPELPFELRLALAVLVLVGVAVALVRGGRVPRRPIAIGLALLALIAAEPAMRWSHLVLLATILTVFYAAAVSLALPDHWEAVRSDLALVALWSAIATGSSLAIAGATFILVARATSALAGAAWMVPHREYVALVVASTLVAAGCAALAVGALGVPDATVAALGALAAVLLLALELAQVARRFRVAEVPPDLDVTSALAAFLATLLAAAVLAVPLAAVVRDQLTDEAIASPLLVVGIAVAGTLLVVLARTVRPILPYVELAAGRSRPAISALDPVPLGVGTFRAIEIGAGRASVAFGLFEQRAGVAEAEAARALSV
ncbi:MAG: hypothetical protein AABZ26_06670, partial [Chloroflexota bacterium]